MPHRLSSFLIQAHRGSGLRLFALNFNNHPIADLMIRVVQDLWLNEKPQLSAVFATLISGDLGCKMLQIGSVAGLMWFRFLG